ncbi:hypothetical protein K2X85_18385 [bacterium]|nr:hypothetical protein [bacterium]
MSDEQLNPEPQQTNSRPAFMAPIYAAARQGLKELAQYLPAFPENPRPIEEPGMMGNPTQQMVTEQSGTLDRLHEKLDQQASLHAENHEPQRNEQEDDMER